MADFPQNLEMLIKNNSMVHVRGELANHSSKKFMSEILFFLTLFCHRTDQKHTVKPSEYPGDVSADF